MMRIPGGESAGMAADDVQATVNYLNQFIVLDA